MPAAHPLRGLDLARRCSWSAAGSAAADDESLELLVTRADVSADWVVPVDGRPDRGRRGRDRRRRPDRRGRAGGGARRGRALRRRGDPPGLRERPLAPRVRRLRRLRRRAPVRAVDRASTSSARRCSIVDDDGGDRARSAPPNASRSGITTVGDASSRGAAATACAELGPARDRLPRGVRRGHRAARRPLRGEPQRGSRTRSPSGSGSGISPHAPYTCSLELYRGLRRARPAARDAPRGERGRGRVDPRRHGPAGEPSPTRLLPTVRRSAIEALAEHGLLGPALLAAHCVHRRPTRRSRCSPSTTSPSRTARARTRCSAAAWRRSTSVARAGLRVGIAHRQPGIDARRSTCSRSCAPRSCAARARERRPTRSRPRTRSSWRRSAARGPSVWTTEIGSLAPGKQADLAVVSLAGSPFLPVEDPVTAVVLGGSPGARDSYSRSRRGPLPERKDGMARSDRRSAKRAKPNAAVAHAAARRARGASIEDTMFFPRLRRHAKWMFVFLALVFGLGFVALRRRRRRHGIGDIFRGAGERERRALGRRRARAHRGEPEGRGGLARSLDRPADRGRHRRGDRRARGVHRPAAEGRRRAARARRALPREGAGAQQEAQLAQYRAQLRRRRRRTDRRSSTAPTGEPLVTDPIAQRDPGAPNADDPDARRRRPGGLRGGGRHVPASSWRLSPEGPERPARARASRRAGGRHGRPRSPRTSAS